MIRLAHPQIDEDEVAAVREVLLSGMISGGRVVERLEQDFAAGVAHTREAVAVSSGTAALHLALLVKDIGPGDEVITTPFTFQATANMVLAVGARPVFVDVDENGNLDPAALAAAVTEKSRAVLPVHLFGRMCDMAEIRTSAAEHSLDVIEDSAQAHGAARGGERAGSFGIGCFSFYATKNMTAGEGGIITTDDAGQARRLRALRAHGEYERYHSAELGFNYRLTDIAAAIALAQLAKLEALTERRRENALFLSENLRGVELPLPPEEPASHVWHQYTVRVADNRDGLREWLRQNEIEAGVFYERLLPDHDLYRRLGYSSDGLPKARQAAAQSLSLPVHPGLSQVDLERIVDAVNSWAASNDRRGLK